MALPITHSIVFSSVDDSVRPVLQQNVRVRLECPWKSGWSEVENRSRVVFQFGANNINVN